MRSLVACVLLIGCTDAADVPTTVVHAQIAATCTSPDCSLYSEVFYNFCGPSGSTAVTATTRDVEVITTYDAKDIAGYVQLQYTSDQRPPGTDDLVYADHVLQADDDVDVYAAYGETVLYRITAAGEVVDIDRTSLSAASGNTLQFRYTAFGVAAQEDHEIDAPIPVRVETDDPGIMDACCSVGGPADGSVVLLSILIGVGRRRARRVVRAA